MKKFLFALMGFICAISVNCAAGAVGASALGVQPVYGVLAVNGVSFLSGLCGASPEIPLFHTIFRATKTGGFVFALGDFQNITAKSARSTSMSKKT